MRIPRSEHLKRGNVVGIMSGTASARRVPHSAHWDHFGRKESAPGPTKSSTAPSTNGMGTSRCLSLREFAHEKRPQRSFGFLFWTMEEQGLLGSEYFAAPCLATDHIVAS